MLFISVEEFFKSSKAAQPITRNEEIDLAKRIGAGDKDALDMMIQGYLYFLSAKIKRLQLEYQTLELVLMYMNTLERLILNFDFFQEGEAFSHRLSLALRNTTVEYIAKR